MAGGWAGGRCDSIVAAEGVGVARAAVHPGGVPGRVRPELRGGARGPADRGLILHRQRARRAREHASAARGLAAPPGHHRPDVGLERHRAVRDPISQGHV